MAKSVKVSDLIKAAMARGIAIDFDHTQGGAEALNAVVADAVPAKGKTAKPAKAPAPKGEGISTADELLAKLPGEVLVTFATSGNALLAALKSVGRTQFRSDAGTGRNRLLSRISQAMDAVAELTAK